MELSNCDSYRIGGCYTFRFTIMLSTVSLIWLNAYYPILSSTEHQKAYVFLKYVLYKNIHMKILSG